MIFADLLHSASNAPSDVFSSGKFHLCTRERHICSGKLYKDFLKVRQYVGNTPYGYLRSLLRLALQWSYGSFGTNGTMTWRLGR